MLDEHRYDKKAALNLAKDVKNSNDQLSSNISNLKSNLMAPSHDDSSGFDAVSNYC